MNVRVERALLQLAIIVTVSVSLSASLISVAQGAGWLLRDAPVPVDLDSHYRYLSGLLLAIAIGFLTCVQKIETKSPRMRMLAAIVIVGGLARLFSLVTFGTPSVGHLGGLAIELGVVPAITLWQAWFARRATAAAI